MPNPSVPEKPPGPSTLLFVDDEPSIRTTLPLVFEANGFHVRVAATVAFALQEITSRQFDVLVADLNISEPRDGLLVVKEARKTNPICICIILTGFADDESRAASLAAGADAYFIKPAAIEELLQPIRERRALVQANAGNRASPNWHALYEAAVLEREPDPAHIAAAQCAVMDRMEDLNRSSDSAENHELMNALNVLRDLRKMADGAAKDGHQP